MKVTAALLILLISLLVGCAPTTQRIHVEESALEAEAIHQKSLALQGWMNDQLRLHRVSYPLLKAARDICKEKTRYIVGTLTMNRHSVSKQLAAGAASQGLHEEMKIVGIAPGSPAAAAGIKPGDVLQSIDGVAVPLGEEGFKAYGETMTQKLMIGKPITFGFRRTPEPVTVTVQPEVVCDYPAQLAGDTAINAFADGERVAITRGMMRFAGNDIELALVISHEIAHNAMSHMDAKMGNRLIGAIFDVLIAAATRTPSIGAFANAAGQAYSQDYEAEADYVGLYIMARAGFPLKEAPLFWRRMAAESPASIGNNHSASHPSTSYRMLALDKAVQEIEKKRLAGLPLNPQMKNETAVKR